MQVHEKIRFLRELNNLSQEEMAEKLHMSIGGYSKIERGESTLNLNRLEQIAQIFNLDIIELLQVGNHGFIFVNDGDNNTNLSFIASNNDAEINHLKDIIKHKEEIISLKNQALEQKEKENQLLLQIIETLKHK